MTDKKFFVCSDGHKMAYNIWMPSKDVKIKAYVQILHGMAEYSDRYEKFAKHLNSKGFVVFAGDHRGHGDSATKEELGWFCEKNGWNRIADDAFELATYILKENEASKLFLFGHSMGSFLARTLMVQHPSFYNGVIVMGTGCSKGIIGKIGKLISKMHGQKTPGTLMNKLSFGSYNKSFEPNRTEYDWLSRDEKEVDKYVKDPLCGFLCTNGFFYDMLSGLEFANNKKNVLTLPKDLPVLLISGQSDPVGDMGKGIEKVYKLYQKANLVDLQMILIPECRHELLNELNKKEIYKILTDWLEQRA